MAPPDAAGPTAVAAAGPPRLFVPSDAATAARGMIETPLPPMSPGVLGAQSSGGYSVAGLDTVLMVWDTIQLG